MTRADLAGLGWGAKVLHLSDQLRARAIPHAFGGAIALNYHREPRSTLDIDIDIFLPPERLAPTLDVLAPVCDADSIERGRAELLDTGQARLLWGDTFIDLFFANTPFHDSMETRTQVQPFLDGEIAVLSIEDLIVCKALFDRPKDWIDIEAVAVTRQGALDAAYIDRWVREFVPDSDPRLVRLADVLA